MIFLDVSKNSGTPKSSHLNRVFHYKPSILGVPLFLETPINCHVTLLLLGRVSTAPNRSLEVSGYRLEGKLCAKNLCTCDYGTEVTGAACPLVQVQAYFAI